MNIPRKSETMGNEEKTVSVIIDIFEQQFDWLIQNYDMARV